MKTDLLTMHPVVPEVCFKKSLRSEPFQECNGAGGSHEAETLVGDTSPRQPANSGKGAFLLMSDDPDLVENLRLAGEAKGQAMIVRVVETAAMFRTLRAIRPAAVLLDLDMPTGAAWEAADRLLQEAVCPPIILLTARSGQMDFRMAVRAGAVVDKSINPDRLLQMLNEALEAPRPVRDERAAIQRVVVLWFNPFHPAAPAASYRHFGINE